MVGFSAVKHSSGSFLTLKTTQGLRSHIFKENFVKRKKNKSIEGPHELKKKNTSHTHTY